MPILQFKGKSFVQNHHFTVKYHELIPQQDKSLTNKVSLYDNLIIQGDNLKALKSLLPSYAGKVKCAYIDPPYNTGNEGWVYNDNVNSPMIREWLGHVVDKEDMTKHDKWLCMMTPRLKLIHELLREDGVIFISIDDNELANLKLLMDEIFLEQNFIACLPTVMNLKGNNDQFGFAGTHEYTLVYGKNKTYTDLGYLPISDDDMKDWDEDEYGYYKKGANLKATGVNAPREKRPNLYYPIYVDKDGNISLERKNPSDVEVLPITNGKEMSWRWSKEKIMSEPHNLIVQFKDDGEISIYKKTRPNDFDKPTYKPKTLFYKPEYSSGNGTNMIKKIFGEKVFNNPKPVELIKDFILIGEGDEEEPIILDAFAGSGTTAHAVLTLNKEDPTKRRKFILIEMEDFADKITAERVRRVIKGLPNSDDDKLREGTGGSFSYFSLGAPIELEAILHGESLPSYEDLARYVFFTATGEEFDSEKLDKDRNFIGDSKDYEVYLFYRPDMEYLKTTSLNIETAQKLGSYRGKKRLVFAPTKFLDEDYLHAYHIVFSQLPFEIYKMKD